MDINAKTSLSDAMRNRANYLTTRQGVISGNIANVNTPKYMAKDVSFAKVLDSASAKIATTNAKHLQPMSAKIDGGRILESKLNPKHNGNTVHIDEQMIKMNEIQLEYRLMTSLRSKLSGMQKMALGAGAAQ